MRCIARRRDVLIPVVFGRSDNAARCRSCRRAPARDYGTALSRTQRPGTPPGGRAAPGDHNDRTVGCRPLTRIQRRHTDPPSGGCANPAHQFGPAVVSGQLNFLWVYLVAPLVGRRQQPSSLDIRTSAALYSRIACAVPRPAVPPSGNERESERNSGLVMRAVRLETRGRSGDSRQAASVNPTDSKNVAGQVE
ncbi:aquaporin [Streptomyces sp. NBC_01718]|uniref:aquaporin n=1 Tax=unclassified Streptomyces TaxID=2593676 RepID=UPI00352CC4C7